MSTKKDGFLTDLEGLRAVAILVVLVFHIDENLLPGGFLGVDLFFVISGYVVTKVLVTDGFEGHVLDFYLTRFHRLIPAATITILFTIVLFFIFANQLMDESFYLSALSSTFSLSNVNFFLASGYWSDELSTNPFLHFWSLSVEEQFYLIWPAILYFLVVKRPKTALLSIGILCLLGIMLLYVIDNTLEYGSFYLMPARIFQFSAGALAFYLSQKKLNFYLRDILFIVGISTFITFSYLINGEGTPVLFGMVIPTLASFFILLGLQTKVSLFTLSNKPLRFIGKISYSLYLVHWPIIVLLKINFGNAILLQLLALVLSFLFGYLLYEKIEKKYRIHSAHFVSNTHTWSKQKALVNIGLFTTSIFTIIIGLIISTPDKSLIVEPVLTEVKTSKSQSIKANTTNFRKEQEKRWACQTFEKGVLGGNLKYKLVDDLDMDYCLKGRVLLIGDSWGAEAAHVLFYVYGLDNVAPLISHGCSPFLNFQSDRYLDCIKFNKFRFNPELLNRYDQIYIATNWNYWSKKNLNELIGFVKTIPQDVYFFSSRPNFSVSVPSIISEHDLKNKSSIDLSNYVKKSKYINDQIIQSGISDSTNIHLIDWNSPLIKEGNYIAYTPDGNLIYKDKTHLTNAGIKYMSKILADKFVWH